MFEALMGYDIFPSLGMLNHSDTGQTRSTSAVSESSRSTTTPSLTSNNWCLEWINSLSAQMDCLTPPLSLLADVIVSSRSADSPSLTRLVD